MNLKEFAKHINLSASTVSRAFRNSHDISMETKERIWAKAKELNYQPNPLASSLRSQRTKTIAVILPEIANNFFSLAINGIESIAQEQGYHVLIYITHEDGNKQEAFLNSLQSGRVDGILISLSNSEAGKVPAELANKLPVVYFDRVPQDEEVLRVTTNDYESAYMATEHLIKKGCRKIAHFYFELHLSISRKRMDGYLDALRDHKIPVNKKLLLDCTRESHSREQIRTLMQSANRPDGIFSSIEKFALQTYEVCAELKLGIPEKVKVITFSNLQTASLLHPSLTTICQPAYDIGQKAASLLFQKLSKKQGSVSKKHFILSSELIERGST
jgi:LacI family transcriptional regulator